MGDCTGMLQKTKKKKEELTHIHSRREGLQDNIKTMQKAKELATGPVEGV